LVPHIEEGVWAEGFENKVLMTQEEGSNRGMEKPA